MLRPIVGDGLVEQWRDIEAGLPDGWREARLRLEVEDEATARRAVSQLGSLNAGRSGTSVRFFCARPGSGPGPDLVRRLLRRLDTEGLAGRLELVAATEPGAAELTAPAGLAAAWDTALTELPPDWSDLLVEVELDSSDYLERGALLLAPVNPARRGGRATFHFRCASRFGYGVSPGMARRCFERLDEAGMTGRVRVLRALSDTQPVATQGPVWYLDGRSV